MEGVDRHHDDVVVLIHKLYHFLRASANIGAQQSGEFAHAVVDMHHIVAYFEGIQFLER